MKKYLLAAAIVLSSSRVFAADSLSAARELYASASYEDALAMLGRLNAAELPPDRLYMTNTARSASWRSANPPKRRRPSKPSSPRIRRFTHLIPTSRRACAPSSAR
jgi:hypothetical protein